MWPVAGAEGDSPAEPVETGLPPWVEPPEGPDMQEMIATVTVTGPVAEAEPDSDPPAELLDVGAGLAVADPDAVTVVTTTRGVPLVFVVMLSGDEPPFPEPEAC